MGRSKSEKNARLGPSSRPAKVGEVMRKEISAVLVGGEVREPRLEKALTTVTDVTVTPDLQHAIVYVSVFSDSKEIQDEVFEGLKSASREIQRIVGGRLTMRYTPRLRFELDHSIDEGAKINRILNEVNALRSDADASLDESDENR
jgi:ribosome-binding factor A